MDLSRRGLFAAGAGLALAGCTAQPVPTARPEREFDPQDWASVRDQFALDPDLIHLAAYVFAGQPAPVRRAIDEHRRGLDIDTAGYLHDHEHLEHEVRTAAADYLGAPVTEVALTDSTTMGLGLLYGGVRLLPGQDVVTTTHDFNATRVALRLLAERTGAPVREIALYDDPRTADATEIVTRLRAAIGPRTRVVAVTWVHSSTGVRLPIRAIADLLTELNAGRAEADQALLCVDGVHGFGAVDAGVEDLGCDFLTTGTHKWLYGPRGTGLLWGRRRAALAPLIPTFSGDRHPGAQFTPGGYHTVEHRWALREAFAFHRDIGRGRVAARIREQATQLKEGLADIATVRLVTPDDPELSAGIVCCEVDGLDAFTATAKLREEHRIVASVTPYERQYLRFGPGIVTTPDQIEETVKAVAALRP